MIRLSMVIALLASSGCSYQGNEAWRRSVCDDIVDTLEKSECLDEATRSDREYRQDVEEATSPAD